MIEGIHHFLRCMPEVDLVYEPMYKDIEEVTEMMQEMTLAWKKMEEQSKHKV